MEMLHTFGEGGGESKFKKKFQNRFVPAEQTSSTPSSEYSLCMLDYSERKGRLAGSTPKDLPALSHLVFTSLTIGMQLSYLAGPLPPVRLLNNLSISMTTSIKINICSKKEHLSFTFLNWKVV